MKNTIFFAFPKTCSCSCFFFGGGKVERMVLLQRNFPRIWMMNRSAFIGQIKSFYLGLLAVSENAEESINLAEPIYALFLRKKLAAAASRCQYCVQFDLPEI